MNEATRAALRMQRKLRMNGHYGATREPQIVDELLNAKLSGPTVAGLIERCWLQTPSIVSDDGQSCGYRVETVGLVSAPIDPSCEVFDALAAHYQVPARMLRGEPLIEDKTQLNATDVADLNEYHNRIYAKQRERLNAAVDRLRENNQLQTYARGFWQQYKAELLQAERIVTRKVKNHGPRGKWGKLK